jgi:rod shape-determining protein MreD
MRWIPLVAMLCLTALVQSLIPPLRPLGHVKPPLLLCLALYVAVRRERRILAAVAAAAGLLQDSLGHTPLGWSSLLFLAVCWPAALLGDLIMTETAAAQAVLGAIFSGVAAMLFGTALTWTGAADFSLGAVLGKSAGYALLGGLCAPLVFCMTGRADRAVGNVRQKKEVEDGG